MISRHLQALADLISSQLQSVVDRLDIAAHLTETVARQLVIDREHAAEDRRQIARLILLIRRLVDQSGDTLLGTERLEQTARLVAEDLAAAIGRADSADPLTPGAGADAALRSGPELDKP